VLIVAHTIAGDLVTNGIDDGRLARTRHDRAVRVVERRASSSLMIF
jgi:hypothetical protein